MVSGGGITPIIPGLDIVVMDLDVRGRPRRGNGPQNMPVRIVGDVVIDLKMVAAAGHLAGDRPAGAHDVVAVNVDVAGGPANPDARRPVPGRVRGAGVVSLIGVHVGNGQV